MKKVPPRMGSRVGSNELRGAAGAGGAQARYDRSSDPSSPVRQSSFRNELPTKDQLLDMLYDDTLTDEQRIHVCGALVSDLQ